MTVITADSLAGGSEPDVIPGKCQESNASNDDRECNVIKRPAEGDDGSDVTYDGTTPCDEQFTFTRPTTGIASSVETTTPSSTSSCDAPIQQLGQQSSSSSAQGEKYNIRKNNDDEGNETGDDEFSRNSTSLDTAEETLCNVTQPLPPPPINSSSLDFERLTISSPHFTPSNRKSGQKNKQRKFKQSHQTTDSVHESLDMNDKCDDIKLMSNDQGYCHQVSSSISMEETSLSSTLTIHSTASAASTGTSHRDTPSRRSNNNQLQHHFVNSNSGSGNVENNTSSRCNSEISSGTHSRSTNTRSSSQHKRLSDRCEASLVTNNIHINKNSNNSVNRTSGDPLYESMIANDTTLRCNNSTPIRTSYTSSPVPPPLPPLLPSMTGTPKLHASSRLTREQLLNAQSDCSNNQTVTSGDNSSITLVNSLHDICVNDNNRLTSVNSNDSTIKKGLLWQMKDGGFFSRWKERYFILTKDYLTCFKKSSSNLSFLGSEMGSFAYKLKLVEVDSINWKSPSDCTGRSKIIPKSIRNKNKKNQKARRVTSSFSSGGVSSDGDSGNDCGVDHEHHNFLRYFSSSSSTSNTATSVSTPGDNGNDITSAGGNNSRNNSHYSQDDQSSSCRSSNSSRKSSSKASNGRQVISISIKNGSSHIDLWTSCDSSLDDWMNCLREASNHSKGRREALIRKSKTLCVPSPNHQPFALSSYWATASRNEHSTRRHEQNQLLSVLGSPAIPHRNQRAETQAGLTCVQNTNGLGRCYSSLQMASSNKIVDVTSSPSNASPSLQAAFSITPAILSESCQRRNRKSSENKRNHDKNAQSRSESMINFSKRVSMITGQQARYHGTGETDVEEENEDENISVEYEAVRLRNRSRISGGQMLQSPSMPHGQRRANHSKLSQQHEQSRQQGSPSILSSLISLDRRLIGCGAPGIPAHRSNVNGSPAGAPSSAATGNDSVRRSALLRSASGIAAAQAAAAAAASCMSDNFTNGASYHAHGISTLGPNQQFNYPPLPPLPIPEMSSERGPPVPRSLQVSPALTQRSLYAQHLFSQPDAGISSPYCTTSKLQSNRSSYNDNAMIANGIRSGIGWMKDELLRSSTASRMINASADDYNNSVLKSATSEFSFVRPDSPLTLPYNKSRSFYGRPVSVSSGVITSNPSLNQNFNGNSSSPSSSSSCVPPPPLPPPRPPLPKQLSLEESSTLFRCSAAASSAAAARATDRAVAKERIAAIRKAAAASASFDGAPTSASSTSSSSGVSSARSSLPEHHSASLLMHLSSPSPRPVSYGYHQSNMHHLNDTPRFDVDYDVDEYCEYDGHAQHQQRLPYQHQQQQHLQQVPLRSNSSIGLQSHSSNCTSKVNDRRKNRMNRILEKTSSQYAQ